MNVAYEEISSSLPRRVSCCLDWRRNRLVLALEWNVFMDIFRDLFGIDVNPGNYLPSGAVFDPDGYLLDRSWRHTNKNYRHYLERMEFANKRNHSLMETVSCQARECELGCNRQAEQTTHYCPNIYRRERVYLGRVDGLYDELVGGYYSSNVHVWRVIIMQAILALFSCYLFYGTISYTGDFLYAICIWSSLLCPSIQTIFTQ